MVNDIKNNSIELDEIIEKINDQNDTINKLRMQIEGNKKDFWDKLKIFGGTISALILAGVAIFGSIFIPKSINERSLVSTQISQLSELIPNIYGTNNQVRAAIIGMSSYGAPAVPSLLAIMQQANLDIAQSNDSTFKIEKEIQMQLSRVAIINIGENAKDGLLSKINFGLRTLSQDKASEVNILYLSDILTILTDIGIDKHWLSLFGFKTDIERSVERYFVKIGKFTSNRRNLSDLNAAAIKALFSIDYPIKKLQLRNLYLNNQKLENVDFTDADLSSSIFRESYLMNSNFNGANLKSADFRKAFFVFGVDTNDDVLKYFINFSKAIWHHSKLDTPVQNLLKGIEDKAIDKDSLLILVGKIH